MFRSLLIPLFLSATAAAQPVSVIFDTDMVNDVDDALALAMLHALESRGECKLLGVTLTNPAAPAGPFAALINRFYGRGSLPIGVSRATRAPDAAQRKYLSKGFRPTGPEGGSSGARKRSTVLSSRSLWIACQCAPRHER